LVDIPITRTKRGRRVYISAVEFKKLFSDAEILEVKNEALKSLGVLVQGPDRALAALEGIAKSQAIMAEFFSQRFIYFKKDGRVFWGDLDGWEHKKGAGKESGADQGNAVIEPDNPKRCASPADRYGWEQLAGGHEGVRGRAVCSIACKFNLTCPVPHRTFDDATHPLASSRDPPQHEDGDNLPHQKTDP
jgi:hypothetical protein